MIARRAGRRGGSLGVRRVGRARGSAPMSATDGRRRLRWRRRPPRRHDRARRARRRARSVDDDEEFAAGGRCRVARPAAPQPSSRHARVRRRLGRAGTPVPTVERRRPTRRSVTATRASRRAGEDLTTRIVTGAVARGRSRSLAFVIGRAGHRGARHRDRRRRRVRALRGLPPGRVPARHAPRRCSAALSMVGHRLQPRRVARSRWSPRSSSCSRCSGTWPRCARPADGRTSRSPCFGFAYVGVLGGVRGPAARVPDGVGLILGVALCAVALRRRRLLRRLAVRASAARARRLAEQDARGPRRRAWPRRSSSGVVDRHHRLHPWNDLGARPAARPGRRDRRAARRPRASRCSSATSASRTSARSCPATAVCSTASTPSSSACRRLLPRGRARPRLMPVRRRRRSSGRPVDRHAGARRHPQPPRRLRGRRARRGPQRRAARRRRPPSSACPATRRALCADDPDVLAELAALPEADVVLNAVVGFAGLPATLAALAARQAARARQQGEPHRRRPGRRRGARRAAAARSSPSTREHSAVYQCLRARRRPTRSHASCSPRAAARSAGRTPRRARPRSPSPTRSSTRRGTWAPRSRSTRRRS